MNWMTGYQKRVVSAEEAIRVVQSGQRVYIGGGCGVPKSLLDALVARAPELYDIETVSILHMGEAPYAQPGMQGHFRHNALFIGANVRQAVNDGRADFTPIHLHEIPDLFRDGTLPLDVAIIQVGPPDEHGFCSFGVEVGITKPAAQAARVVVAEVNERMPRILGDSFIHWSKLDYVVPVSRPLNAFPQGESGDVQDMIARHISMLIDDGSTMQMGIGGIPDAVLSYLHDRRHLGVHTELFSDGVVGLVEEGVITNEVKTLHPGKCVAGFVLGSQLLFDWADNNPIVELHPTDYVNDPFIIAQNERMISINSAIQIDLTGQVCADSIGEVFYSGVGGQVDFVRGAARSKGGKPIIALPATAKNGTISRIVPVLDRGAGVVTSRGDVHYVATEYGVVNLHGQSVRQRAGLLISVAAPQFREQLQRAAAERHLSLD
jgi:4-hydroxybutyrate CoA-transferase